MKPLIVFGTGKISDVFYHHVVRDAQYEVVAFTCDAAWVGPTGSTHLDLPLLPFETLEQHIAPHAASVFVAVGYHELNGFRARKCQEVKAKGFALASYVSPRADVGPWLKVGENCMILDGVGIQPGVQIGDNVSIWNNTLVGHHSVIGDHCWIAAGATIGGGVNLGARSFVGLNATLGGEASIGADSFIGAATLVLKNAPEKSVFIAPGTDRYRLDSTTFMRLTTMPALGSGRAAV